MRRLRRALPAVGCAGEEIRPRRGAQMEKRTSPEAARRRVGAAHLQGTPRFALAAPAGRTALHGRYLIVPPRWGLGLTWMLDPGRWPGLACVAPLARRCSGQRPAASQPRANEARAPPWVWEKRMTKAPTGRHKDGLPRPGGAFALSARKPQGGATASLALGWLVKSLWPQCVETKNGQSPNGA